MQKQASDVLGPPPPRSRNRWLSGLVVYYGLYQLGHAVLNTAYLLEPGSPPFPPPPGGWHPQSVAFLTGMAIFDLANAVLSLVFVIGFLYQARWSLSLGLLCLTVSIYAAAVFTWGTIGAGAWSGQIEGYLIVYAPFPPVLVLAAALAAGAVRGR